MKKRLVVMMYDWDGCLVDTMPIHADLAADCIQKFFGMPFDEARENYLATTGIPFDKQLQVIFPDGGDLIGLCAKEYHQRKLAVVYGNPANFPETEKIIKSVANVCTDFVQVISSSTEENLIEAWAIRHGLARDLFRIYGPEHGTKGEHIALIRKTFTEAKIVFISDSAGDMKLPADVCIGVEAGEEADKFFESGADGVLQGPIHAERTMEVLYEILTPYES